MKRIGLIIFGSLACLIGFVLAFGSDILQFSAGQNTAAATGFIQTLTAPASGSFTATNFNTGSGVVTTQRNLSSPVTAITLLQNDPNATLEIAGLTKVPINAAFTITLGFTLATFASTTNTGLGGIWLTDGSANNLVFSYNTANPGIIATVYSTFAGAFVSNAFFGTGPPAGPLIWLRIQETASNRLYSYSSDGQTWVQIFSEANTAHFTTADYGFAAEQRAAGQTMITAYSFSETTP